MARTAKSPKDRSPETVPAADRTDRTSPPVASTDWIHASPRMSAQRHAVARLFGPPPVQRVINLPEKKKATVDEVIAWLKLNAAGASTGKVADRLGEIFAPGTSERETLADLVTHKKAYYDLTKTTVFDFLSEHFGIASRQAITDLNSRGGKETTSSKSKKSTRDNKPSSSRARTKHGATQTSDGESDIGPSSKEVLKPSTSSRGGGSSSSSSSVVGRSNTNTSPELERPPQFPAWQEPQSTFSAVKLFEQEEESGSGSLAVEEQEEKRQIESRSYEVLGQEALFILQGCNGLLSRPLLCDQGTMEDLRSRAERIKKDVERLHRRVQTAKTGKEDMYTQEVDRIAVGFSSLTQAATKAQGHLLRCVKLLYDLGLRQEEGFKVACDTLVMKHELSGMKKIVGELLGATVVGKGLGSDVILLRDIVALELTDKAPLEETRKTILPMKGDPTRWGVPCTEFDALVCRKGLSGGLQILNTVEAKGGQEDPSLQITGKQRPFLQKISTDQSNFCFAQPVGNAWESLNPRFDFTALLVGDHKTITAGPAAHFSIDFTQVLGVSYAQFEIILRFIAADV